MMEAAELGCGWSACGCGRVCAGPGSPRREWGRAVTSSVCETCGRHTGWVTREPGDLQRLLRTRHPRGETWRGAGQRAPGGGGVEGGSVRVPPGSGSGTSSPHSLGPPSPCLLLHLGPQLCSPPPTHFSGGPLSSHPHQRGRRPPSVCTRRGREGPQTIPSHLWLLHSIRGLLCTRR